MFIYEIPPISYMGLDEVNRIKAFFTQHNIAVTYLHHKAVITSEDAAKTRGFELKQGVKAILFTNDSLGWVIANISADKKVDQKKVAEHMSWSKGKIRMATPEEVLQKTGCEIGAVPPFGHKEQLHILVDKNIYDNKENAFNIGLRTDSVKIKTENMKKVFNELKVTECMLAK